MEIYCTVWYFKNQWNVQIYVIYVSFIYLLHIPSSYGFKDSSEGSFNCSSTIQIKQDHKF